MESHGLDKAYPVVYLREFRAWGIIIQYGSFYSLVEWEDGNVTHQAYVDTGDLQEGVE